MIKFIAPIAGVIYEFSPNPWFKEPWAQENWVPPSAKEQK